MHGCHQYWGPACEGEHSSPMEHALEEQLSILTNDTGTVSEHKRDRVRHEEQKPKLSVV